MHVVRLTVTCQSPLVGGNAQTNLHVRFLVDNAENETQPMSEECECDSPCPSTAARPFSSFATGRMPVNTMMFPTARRQTGGRT